MIELTARKVELAKGARVVVIGIEEELRVDEGMTMPDDFVEHVTGCEGVITSIDTPAVDGFPIHVIYDYTMVYTGYDGEEYRSDGDWFNESEIEVI